MVAQDRLERIYNQLELSPRARAILAQTQAQPAHNARNKAGTNVRGRYPSAKMSVTIQFSSHKLELPAILELEYDPAVVAFWDSPPAIRLSYNLANGRNYSTDISPTFLVVGRDRVYYEEWKQEESLVGLARKMPNRYVRVDAGAGNGGTRSWRCPPGEESAATLGFDYRVRSSSEINWTLQANLIYLQTYFAAGIESLTVDESLAETLIGIARGELGITMAELRARAEREFSDLNVGHVADAINTLIVTQRLFVNLRAERLAEPTRVHVYVDADLAYLYTVMADRQTTLQPQSAPRTVHIAIGAPLLWDGAEWAVANLGARETTLIGLDKQLLVLPNDKVQALIKQGSILTPQRDVVAGLTDAGRRVLAYASPQAREIAGQRYRSIESMIGDHPPRALVSTKALPAPAAQPGVALVSERTLFRWLKQYREGVGLYGDGFVGLIDHRNERGRRGERYAPEIADLVDRYIKEYYETLTHITRQAAYAKLVTACQEGGLSVPSYKYFCKRVKGRPGHEQALRRKGRRAAYNLEDFYWELTLTTPRHGSRFMEIAHLDHTEVDIEMVMRDGTTRMGRGWLTSLSEATTRTELVAIVSYDSPNKATPLRALRVCAELWGRLPEILVVDNGADLRSTDLDVFAARYRITVKVRPAAKPRYGSVGERWFGSTNTQFIHALQGNTQLMRYVRQVTKRENPRERAIWNLPAFQAALQYWAYEVYDQMIHSTLGMSPRDARLLSTAESGAREHTIIPYDEDFIRETMPSAPRRVAKVQPSLGVKVNNIYYWHDSMRGPNVVGTKVHVRYDPYNIGRIYAYIDGRWVECISEHYALLGGHSTREVEQATEIIRQKYRARGAALTINARLLGEFLNSVEAAEVLLEQRQKDAETRAAQAYTYQPSSADDSPDFSQNATPSPPTGRSRGEPTLRPLPVPQLTPGYAPVGEETDPQPRIENAPYGGGSAKSPYGNQERGEGGGINRDTLRTYDDF